MKKACVIGHFGFGHNLLNGQTVKTKIVSAELEKQLPGEVIKIDTHGGIKSLIKAPFHIIKSLNKSRNVIIFPAHNGLRVHAPLLSLIRPFFKGRKLHYVVIGGWLAPFLKQKKMLTWCLKKFDGIYVETSTMKRALEELGLDNVVIMPNCKELQILSPEELVFNSTEPYKLCTFSRVMKEKGIEDAVNAVKAVNENLGRVVYTLDIYGQIDTAQIEWFDELQKTFPDYVKYGGIVPFDKSVDVLKEYFALLFPTHYYTEGIPGTIIDAYAAGIPVISVKWESFSDIINDGVTGIGINFGDQQGFSEMLLTILYSPDKFNKMKINCLKESTLFLPSQAIDCLIGRLK